MPLPGRRVVLLACALALLAAAVAGRLLGGGDGGPARAAAPAGSEGVDTAAALPVDPSPDVAVHVAGAVKHPGVYRLPAGSRALDAVQRAGGGTRRADLDAVNLAALVADGERIVVPLRPAPGTAPAAGGATGGATERAPTAIVHLNGATPEDLDALPGVGPALAERIATFGREHGGFRSVDDLQEVPGIGPGRMEALRGLVAP